jgi:hypothetical protein
LRRIWHFLFHPKPDSISRSHSTSCARNRKFLFLPSCARQPPIHSSILCCSRVDNKSHSKLEPAAGCDDRNSTKNHAPCPTAAETQSVAKSNPLLFLMLNEICQVQFFGNLPKHFEMQAAPTFDENAPLSS